MAAQTAPGTAGGGPVGPGGPGGVGAKKRSPGPNFSLASQVILKSSESLSYIYYQVKDLNELE